jgi:anti-sigma-K factor RskA
MTNGDHITQEDLAFYAMQGLSQEDTASISQHLQSCAPCRAELAGVLGDLALVGLSVKQEQLPLGARQRFLQKLASDPRTSPVGATPVVLKSKNRGSGFWVPWVATAAMAIATISLAVQNRALNADLHDQLSLVTNLAAQASRAQQVLEVLTAPSAERVTLTEGKLPVQPTARATYLPERGGVILLATNLRPLPEGKTYELWVIPANGKAPVPAGTFRPDTVGSATLVLPTLPSGIAAKAFGVTIENAGGSSTPTAPIVLSGAVGS